VISLRRAQPDDADFVVELLSDADVDPFLGPRAPRDRDGVLAEIERSLAEPRTYGRLVIEVDGERAGTFGFHETNARNRIAHLEALAVHPAFRGRGIGDEAARQAQRLLFELGYHRLELAVYGFNERALRHAERAGYVREGVKRKAYWRHGAWQDAVQFALVEEDLAERHA
jgi:RimJ/RimL family protein N-acetyltransferase